MRVRHPRLRSGSGRRTLLGFAAAVLAVLGVGALLVVGPGGAGSDESDLPTLPPIDEREPGVFDGDGCLRVEDECTVQADELDAVAAGAPGDEFRTLEGFTGPRYTTDLSSDAVVVLDDTVADAVAEDGTWTATGLVRNETGDAVADVEVTASLLGPDGAEVATATAQVPVAPLRPGEPAPFVVDSVASPADVASVDWSVEVAAPSGDEPRRAVELTTYWTEVAGEREAVAVAGHTDPEGAKPHLVFGSATGLDGADVDAPAVVAAWFAEDGSVLHVADAEVVSLADAEPLDSLGPGGLGDFLLVVDGPVAPSLASAELALWAVGS